jgi:CubicO group peptidase (beta-lactamase class C family)
MNRPDARRACVPASSGIMSARSLARLYAALLPGGVDGVELLPPCRVREATVRQIPSGAAPGPQAARISLGYFLGGEGDDMGHRPTVFGHGGFGGSIGFADPECRLAVGLTKNLFFAGPEARGSVLRELREALGVAM